MNKTFFGHPIGLSTLFFTEMWERFSYYGMRAILILFMTTEAAQTGLGLTTETAGAIYALYTAGVYLLTLPGGWIADNLIGQRKAIWYGGIMIMCGHLILAIPGSSTIFFIGLAFVAIGTGLLKPNISTIVGDLYPGDTGSRRDAGFTLFYMGINLGSFLGQIFVPLLAAYNWHLGFGLAAVGMFLGLIVYRLSEYKTLDQIGIIPKVNLNEAGEEKRQAGTNRTITIVIILLLALIIYALQFLGYIDLFTATGFANAVGIIIVSITLAFFINILVNGGLTTIEKKKVAVIFMLFVGAAIFWAGFEQAGSSLNLFTRDFTMRDFGPLGWSSIMPVVPAIIFSLVAGYFYFKHVFNREDLFSFLKYGLGLVVLGFAIFIWWLFAQINQGWEMPAGMLQSANAFFIIIFAPVIGALWVKLATKNMNPSTPVKFAIGLILLGIGFWVMVLAARIAADGAKAGVFALILTYFFHSIGELALSPVGLSTTTKLAPKKYVGQMMGIWFVGTSLGNLIAGLFGGRFDPSNVQQMPGLFWFVVLTSIGAGIIFFILSPFMKRWMGDIK